MDLKKIALVIIILLIVLVGAFCLFTSSGDRLITYDDHFNVTVPDSFESDENSEGLIESVYPENKSYVLEIVEEENETASSMDSDFALLASSSNIDGFEVFTDLKNYTIGNNKVYEYTSNNTTFIQTDGQLDAKIVRAVSFVVPNSDKVYSLYFMSNDTSVDLHNADIEAIINSTASD